VSGATDIAMMHLDTLGGFDQVGICIGYRLEGQTLTAPPAHALQLEAAEPVIEYMPDLAGCLTDLSQRLAPGARLYLTTARRCPLRLVGQVGNALRQGFWLHARSEGQMRTALARAGLTVESLTAFGPGRLLLEVLARKQD
jgi:hypothetical protein